MLREIKIEQLPSYELGWEKGIAEGEVKGKAEGKAEGEAAARLESALIMIRDFHINPETVSEKLDIPLDVLLGHTGK